jgi:hypothetical protein
MTKPVSILLGLVLLGAGLVSASAVAGEGSAPSAVPAVIAGSGEVGSVLRITSPGSVTGPVTYTWLWDGEQDPGPGDDAAAHTVTRDDVGHELSVLVKPAGDGERLESNRIVAVGAAIVAPTVEVNGTATVGRTLTARFTSKGTEGADVTLGWTRDGLDIPGATVLSYVLVPDDAGHVVRLRTTSTTTEGRSLDAYSAGRKVPAWTSSRPTVKGVAKVGRTQTMRSRGAWSGAGYRYTYRWLRNGHAISKATRTSYRLTSGDKGRRITLQVTATRKGYPTVRSTSARSAKVR